MRSTIFMATAIAFGLFSSIGYAGGDTPQTTMRGDGGVPDFYSWQAPLPAKPGRLLRSEPMIEKAPLEAAAKSIRILYTSTDGIGGAARVTVSGALYLPKGTPPKGGWPLIAWAHGTVGVADICAPSFTGRYSRDITYLNFWLGQGYAVVASDYQGLGTPGGHPYLATRPVAYSVLDSIRAVQGKAFGIGRKVVLVGQSQGGGAAVATLGHAPAYAPEIDIRGTVATGTPYFDAKAQAAIEAARPIDLVDPLLTYNFYILSLQQQLEPGFKLEDHVTELALPAAKLAGSACFIPVVQKILADKLTRRNTFKVDPSTIFERHAAIISYPTLKFRSPLFMGIGGKDRDVPPSMQKAVAADACKVGSIVEVHVYPDADHSGAVNGSTKDSSVFVKMAFSGEKIVGNCEAR